MVDSLLESAIKNDDTSSNFEEKLADYCSSHGMSWTNNPLLLASKHGSINCASEIVRLRPELACARNSDGYTAMHSICDSGDVMMVKRLVEISPPLCLLRDLPHWRTPLHDAAVKGNGQVLREIVKVCPQSLATYTRQNESVLHLALKYDRVGCFQVLIQHLLAVDHVNDPMINLKELLNHKDCEGNTILHIAASRNQIKIVKMLLSDNPIITSLVEVNATNQMGFTALDLHSQNHPSMIDREITNLLLLAGRNEECNLPNSSKLTKEEPSQRFTALDVINQNHYEKILNNDIIAANKRMHEFTLKTMLLTVAILVAGGSYATLFNLNTIYPKQKIYTVGTGQVTFTISLTDMVMGLVRVPGLFYFMVLNTITFTGSVVVIVVNSWSLVSIWSSCFAAVAFIVLGSMCVSYALLVFKIIPKFSLTIIGSLEISSFWAVWLFSLPSIFFIIAVWLAFNKKFLKSSYNIAKTWPKAVVILLFNCLSLSFCNRRIKLCKKILPLLHCDL